MSRPLGDRTYYDWEQCPPFEVKDGRVVHLVRTPGRGGSEARVSVFDAEVDPEDPGSVELGIGDHLLGELKWWPSVREINYVWVAQPEGRPEGEKPWGRQGIGAEMLRRAREIEPSLRHAPCSQRSEDGEKFVRATDYDERCQRVCGEGCRNPLSEEPPENDRSPGLWSRIRGRIGL